MDYDHRTLNPKSTARPRTAPRDYGDNALNVRSLAPLCYPHPLRRRPLNHRCQHRIEQRLRNEPIEWCAVLSALDRADVRSRPAEAVEFGHHDPAALGIEAKMSLYSRRDFEGVFGASGRLRRHGDDEQLGVPVHLRPRDHDNNGALLAAILLAPCRLMRPEVGIGQDISGFRYRP